MFNSKERTQTECELLFLGKIPKLYSYNMAPSYETTDPRSRQNVSKNHSPCTVNKNRNVNAKDRHMNGRNQPAIMFH